MINVFHAGELAVQERAGVRAQASKIGLGIRAAIPDFACEMLREQRLAVIASVDREGRVWASVLTAAADLIEVLGRDSLRIHAWPAAGDPLRDNVRPGADVGILAIDFSTRRRVRVNGRLELAPVGSLLVRTRQVYVNCPKYIQRRVIDAPLDALVTSAVAEPRHTLSPAQQRWIADADTFFIASVHPEAGADASHRGGNPGFVRVLSDDTLLFPDYAGNTMFNTLGNIAANPHVGLLFVDFERGGALQLTGSAAIIWDDPRTREFAGAERLVRVSIDTAIEHAGALHSRWQLVDRSPHNPA
jgi:predicted pyridoxine 5'-phosphate oxidase superfamily flavin-nucleotide-binding protein